MFYCDVQIYAKDRPSFNLIYFYTTHYKYSQPQYVLHYNPPLYWTIVGLQRWLSILYIILIPRNSYANRICNLGPQWTDKLSLVFLTKNFNHVWNFRYLNLCLVMAGMKTVNNLLMSVSKYVKWKECNKKK